MCHYYINFSWYFFQGYWRSSFTDFIFLTRYSENTQQYLGLYWSTSTYTLKWWSLWVPTMVCGGVVVKRSTAIWARFRSTLLSTYKTSMPGSRLLPTLKNSSAVVTTARRDRISCHTTLFRRPPIMFTRPFPCDVAENAQASILIPIISMATGISDRMKRFLNWPPAPSLWISLRATPRSWSRSAIICRNATKAPLIVSKVVCHDGHLLGFGTRQPHSNGKNCHLAMLPVRRLDLVLLDKSEVLREVHLDDSLLRTNRWAPGRDREYLNKVRFEPTHLVTFSYLWYHNPLFWALYCLWPTICWIKWEMQSN